MGKEDEAKRGIKITRVRNPDADRIRAKDPYEPSEPAPEDTGSAPSPEDDRSVVGGTTFEGVLFRRRPRGLRQGIGEQGLVFQFQKTQIAGSFDEATGVFDVEALTEDHSFGPGQAHLELADTNRVPLRDVSVDLSPEAREALTKLKKQKKKASKPFWGRG